MKAKAEAQFRKAEVSSPLAIQSICTNLERSGHASTNWPQNLFRQDLSNSLERK
jgi:hypothetical protein